MHKLNIFTFLCLRLSVCLLWTVIGLATFGGEVRGQSNPASNQASGKQESEAPATIPKELLPASLGNQATPDENWRAIGPERSLSSDQWSVLPDADVYTEYGLERLISRVYSKGKQRITIEAFKMKFTSGAYGLMTFNRGRLSTNRLESHIGRYLISIASDPSDTSIDPALIEAVKKSIPTSSDQFPTLPLHLPKEIQIAESEKYIVGPTALTRLKNLSELKGLIDFAGGAEVAAADYQNGDGKMTVAIVEYLNPQMAGDGQAQASKYYDALSQSDKQKRLHKRIGNYIAFAINVSDQPAAERVLSQIKYTPRVYWEGRKLSDVPVAYRQPDTAGVEEATKTIKVLVRSFYWIGSLLLGSILFGLLFGSVLFYWKRYRRRKLGIDDLFADTGETVRLNLDEYLLRSDEPAIKQIGDGKK